MSKIIWLVLLLVLLVGCVAEPAVTPTQGLLAPVANTLVALPEDASTLILALVTAGLAWLLLQVNLGQYTQSLAAVIAPILVTVAEGFLGTIPPVFDNLVLSILHLVVLFVSGSVGAFLLVKRAKYPATLLSD